jgi:hypothetical protein
MKSWRRVLRVVVVAAGAWPLSAGSLLAAEQPAATPPSTSAAPTVPAPDASVWQAAISGQIAAFRKGDAAAALSFANAAFRRQFTDPNAFMLAVAAAGYGPIFTSKSESFGDFQQIDAASVAQEVHLVGPAGETYVAIYTLGKEADGWRIAGVVLRKTSDVSA